MATDQSKRRFYLVSAAGGDVDSATETIELVVRHRWDQSFILIVALTMLCVGILCGLVASHVTKIESLEHDVRLALTWAQTHRHPAPGEQPERPEGTQELPNNGQGDIP